MLDADRRFEDRLRAALAEEAASLPFTLTVGDLERRLAERPRRFGPWTVRVWIAAAALVLLAAAGAAGIATLLLQDQPEPPAPTLPTSEALLAEVPETTLLLDGRRLADDATSSPAPDDRYVVGRITPAERFVVVAACLGVESVTVEVGDLESLGTYLSTPVRCGDRVEVAQGSEPSTGETLDVTVIAPSAASWAVTVGEYPTSLTEPPLLSAVETTPGWSVLVGMDEATLAEPGQGTGLGITVPPSATRVATWFTCVGERPATATLGSASVVVDCPSGATERLEVPADRSARMDARITSEARMWARLVAEIDTGIEIVYDEPPPLPADVAATTWAATGTRYLTIGTLGSNEPRLLEVAVPGLVDAGTHRAGVARGDIVPLAVVDGKGGGRIDLVSVSGASVVRTVLRTDAFVQDVWLAATHEIVVYVVGTGGTIQFRSVRIDGTDDRALVDIPVDDPADPLFSLAPGLARDDSVYVIETCRAAGCERSIVDLATGEIRTIDTTADPVCSMIGVIDGLVIGRQRAGCERDDTAPVSVVASPLEGGPSRTLEAATDADGVVVPTRAGPRLVVARTDDASLDQTIVAIDPTTGEATTILERAGDQAAPSFVTPMAVHLPEGYVLLAASLGDEPASRGFFVRTVPILLNLDTGERIDLPNLPHTLDGTP